jgi:hypothetical protein
MDARQSPRHSRFMALRDDKKATDVKRETGS